MRSLIPDPHTFLDRYWISGLVTGMGGMAFFGMDGVEQFTGLLFFSGGLIWSTIERQRHDGRPEETP